MQVEISKNTYSNKSTGLFVIYLKKIDNNETIFSLIEECELWNVSYYQMTRTMYAEIVKTGSLDKLLSNKIVVRVEKNNKYNNNA